MRIGVPKEIKPQENRIGLTPDSVRTLVSEGHEVLVEIMEALKRVLTMISTKMLVLKLLKKPLIFLMTLK